MPPLYNWNTDTRILARTIVKWGDPTPECKENMHYFRRSFCRCGELSLTDIKLIVEKEKDAQA